ncbi:MAG: TIGR00366 family protein, partial [Flavobacteriales bacterium]
MKSFSEKFIRAFRAVLPSPLTIAVLLSFLTFFIALFLMKPEGQGVGVYSIKLLRYWEKGMWNTAGLEFAIQMMLMLVLGHVLALSKPVNKVISFAAE